MHSLPSPATTNMLSLQPYSTDAVIVSKNGGNEPNVREDQGAIAALIRHYGTVLYEAAEMLNQGCVHAATSLYDQDVDSLEAVRMLRCTGALGALWYSAQGPS
jgi:hypothetical protein